MDFALLSTFCRSLDLDVVVLPLCTLLENTGAVPAVCPLASLLLYRDGAARALRTYCRRQLSLLDWNGVGSVTGIEVREAKIALSATCIRFVASGESRDLS